jgi:hypothetical protein
MMMNGGSIQTMNDPERFRYGENNLGDEGGYEEPDESGFNFNDSP